MVQVCRGEAGWVPNWLQFFVVVGTYLGNNLCTSKVFLIRIIGYILAQDINSNPTPLTNYNFDPHSTGVVELVILLASHVCADEHNVTTQKK